MLQPPREEVLSRSISSLRSRLEGCWGQGHRQDHSFDKDSRGETAKLRAVLTGAVHKSLRCCVWNDRPEHPGKTPSTPGNDRPAHPGKTSKRFKGLPE